MFRISIEAMLLAPLDWELWFGLALLAFVTTFARRRFRRDAAPLVLATYKHAVSIVGLIVLPLAMLAWGLYFWPEEGRRGAHELFALRGLDVLSLCQLAVCLALVWRWKGRLGVAFSAALSMWWAAGALVTATMAVTNTWL